MEYGLLIDMEVKWNWKCYGLKERSLKWKWNWKGYGKIENEMESEQGMEKSQLKIKMEK